MEWQGTKPPERIQMARRPATLMTFEAVSRMALCILLKSESRVTLATIDAAAIDPQRASPPITGVCERRQPMIRRFPSTRT